MNKAKQELSGEKKQAILMAALEVFGTNDYKDASTDLIAAKAGISKGLLFYYFKNKKELYFYVMDEMIRRVRPRIVDQHFYEITDFFDLIIYAGEWKMQEMSVYPYLAEFSVRAYYSTREAVTEDMNQLTSDTTKQMFREYFQKVDLSKFKEDKKSEESLQMLIWLTDGYMHQQMMAGRPLDMEALMVNYRKWAGMLRTVYYKEEYIEEA